MITETFYKRFATEMCNVGRETRPLSDEEYSYMMGLIKGAYLWGNITQKDHEDICDMFDELNQGNPRYIDYIHAVRDLMTKQREVVEV